MNRKGFTLVELIAMMVVISVLMVIAVPNISGIIKKNRESIGAEDVNKMVRDAKTKFSVKKASYPKNVGSCVVLSMNYLDTNEDFKSGVNGETYDKDESVVVVKKVQKSSGVFGYEYYVRLVEVGDSKTYIIGLVNADEYSKKTTPSHVEELTANNRFSGKDLTGANTVINNIYGSGLCSGVDAFYQNV